MRRGRWAVLCALALGLSSGAHADPSYDGDGLLPLDPPTRPFLLVDAPRRFVPGQSARVRVQLRGGGQVRLALFRVRDPASALGLAGQRQGVSVARDPIGAEAEALLAGDVAIGQRLELVRSRWVRMPKPREARQVADESEVYDSNEAEEDEVATYWVQTGGFSVRDVGLGRLATGLYLVRVHAGPWATTAILSVGRLVLLARRGDTHDVVHVTDADGRPLPGVPIRAEAEGQVLRSGSTGDDGTLRMPAADTPTVRFVAERGDDVAWADVTHARLDPCDPRVYLATGRPLYRSSETVFVRGHVRGCDDQGRFVALADEPVRLSPAGDGSVEVRTDEDGNFVAQMHAQDGTLTAEIRGEEQVRDIRLDHRQLPVRGIQVRVDRPFAASGGVVRVEVADEDGGWPRPRDVILDTPAGRFMGRIGPGRPAVFHVTVPPTDAPAERFDVHATLTDGMRVTMASGELWVGRSPLLLELDSPRARGRSGERFPLRLRATDLVGSRAAGRVRLAVFGTDGNSPQGQPRWHGEVRLSDAGAASLGVPLAGDGPWLVEARRGASRARLVVWARERPPQLSGRGPLAIAPRTDRVDPGDTLSVDVRLPPGRGRAWLTLEQGSVWHGQTLPRAQGRTVRATFRVPERARGLAKLVVAHVSGGEVKTASATVEVRTARELAVGVTTDRRTYAQGETAKVAIAAHTTDGRPSDGVVTLWLADAGYWEMGEDDYPLPDEYLRLPGRMATGGDSTEPLGYGAEEGRVLPDARMEWNGQRLDRTTYRHGWGHYGRLVRVDRRGTLQQVVRELARGAGLDDGYACPDTVEELGTVSLLARDLPWDLVAVKLSQQIGLLVHLDEGVLRYECPDSFGLGGGGMGGAGHGAGVAGLRTGAAGLARLREERLEGTLRFVGLRRLGPDGRLDLDLALPDHPGRWRIEVLAIRDDGGGARAHAIAHTRRPLEVWTDLPSRLLPGDEAPGAIHVRAPSLAGQTVDLSVLVPMALSLEEEPPATVTLDGRGEARVPLRVQAQYEGTPEVVVRATANGQGDAIRKRIQVLPDTAEHLVSMRALVGPEATDVHIPLPELSDAATLEVTVDSGLRQSIGDALEGLREPRWHLPAMRIDRLHSLRALADAASRLPDTAQRRLLEAELRHAHASEAAALARLVTPAGGVGWWTSLPDDARLTAEALIALGPRAGDETWSDGWDALRQRVEHGQPRGEDAAVIALALAHSPRGSDHALAEGLLDAASTGSPLDVPRLTHATLAARTLGDRSRSDSLSAQLEAALRSRVADGGRPGPCRGPVWFLCYERWGERGELAHAASALLDARGDARALALDTLRWLIAQGPTEQRWVWGSADGDVLALASRLYPSSGGTRRPLRVLVDGSAVPVRGGRVEIPAGAHDVRVTFAADPGRLLRVRVDGTVRAPPPTAPRGNVRLVRRFEQDDGTWTVAVEVELPDRTEDVDLSVPLPAGLELAAGAEPPAGARLAVVDGALRLHWTRMRAGRTRVRLPLVALAPGTFVTPPARLRDARHRRWALTAATSTTVR